MDKQKATFSNIGASSSGAAINGSDVRINSGKFDIVGLPAMLNYLDQISVSLERLSANSGTVGIVAALTAQAKQLELLTDAIIEQETTVNVSASPIEVNVPELEPKVTVTPHVEVKTPSQAGFVVLLSIITALFFIMTLLMLDSNYAISDIIMGGGHGGGESPR